MGEPSVCGFSGAVPDDANVCGPPGSGNLLEGVRKCEASAPSPVLSSIATRNSRSLMSSKDLRWCSCGPSNTTPPPKLWPVRMDETAMT